MKQRNVGQGSGNRSRKAKILFYFLGVTVVFGGLTIPMSSTQARGALKRGVISIGVGIAKYVGIEVTSNAPGTDVSYENGVYSKTMTNGESISNFGTTTFKIICNFDTNTDSSYQGGYNCKDNGWALTTTPEHTSTVQGTTYAAMIDPSSSATILSQDNSFTSQNSNWAVQVTAISRTISGTDVSPTITSGYTSPHIIPATSTEIASGKSFKTISGDYTYIDSFGVSVQHGINISYTQAAGSYTGSVDYTVALKASS